MSKFTSGPWKVCKQPGEIFSVNIESITGQPIAECFVSAESGLADGIREASANALLMGAAPEMIGALKDAHSFITGRGGIDYLQAVNIIESAINKAVGDE